MPHNAAGTKSFFFVTLMRLELVVLTHISVHYIPVLAEDERVSPDILQHDEDDLHVQPDAEDRHRNVIRHFRLAAERAVRREEHIPATEDKKLKYGGQHGCSQTKIWGEGQGAWGVATKGKWP